MTMTNDDGVRLAEYVRWLTAAGNSPGTIDLRRSQIARLARELPCPLHASTDDLVAWLAGHNWNANTRRSHRNALRTYYGWALNAGYIEADPSRMLPSIRHRPGIPRPASEDSMLRAIATADERTHLMITIAAQTGMRRGEIASVHTRDVEADLQAWSLRVRGKGDRTRLLPLTDDLARRLRARPAGWVFPSPVGGHLTPAHVGKLISAALGPGVTTHQLRHRFATRAYSVDHDLLSVQQLLGHAKPETTMIYTQIPAGAKRHIIDAVA